MIRFFEDDDIGVFANVAEDIDDEDDLLSYRSEDLVYPDEPFVNLERKNESIELLSLQNICLKSISKNLLRFNLAYSTTEDLNFQRNLKFLQRVHTSYLIKIATNGGKKLKESYFDFLLNQYIKEFNMGLLYKCDWDHVFKRVSEIGHGFEKVTFNFPETPELDKVVDFVNKIVCHLSNVQILYLNSHCDDSTLEIVASSCLQLKELYIDDCSVTDKGLKSLCQKNEDNVNSLNLKHISLSDINNDDGIAYLLQNMPSLEVIVHHNLPYILHKLHKDNMNNTLEKKYNLTSLYLGGNSPWKETPTISDILTSYSNTCPHIKDLSLSLTSKEHLDLCLKFSELEYFSAMNVGSNQDLDLNEFLKSKGGILQRLNVENFTLSVAVLVQNCLKLETLDLQNMTFQASEPGVVLQPLNSLQELSLGFFNFSDDLVRCSIIDILNSSKKIEKLSLQYVTFEDNEEIITRLSKFCEGDTLTHLKFTNCDVNDAFLQSVLLTCSNLKILEIVYCENIAASHIQNLYEISSSLKNQTKIIWLDDRSGINSLDSGDDLFDDYSGYDTDDYDNDDPYDSDNLYYGYDFEDRY